MADFPETLRNLRKEKGLTQSELGKIFNLSKQTISGYEKDGNKPPLETAQLLADFFGITLDELMGRDKPTTSEATKKPQDLRKILEQHEIMFDGVPIDEDSKEDILHIIEFELYKKAKEMNKRKKKEGVNYE